MTTLELMPTSRTTERAMDGECAFCGRADAATQQVLCVDCRVEHRVCAPCAETALKEGTVESAPTHLPAAA